MNSTATIEANKGTVPISAYMYATLSSHIYRQICVMP